MHNKRRRTYYGAEVMHIGCWADLRPMVLTHDDNEIQKGSINPRQGTL